MGVKSAIYGILQFNARTLKKYFRWALISKSEIEIGRYLVIERKIDNLRYSQCLKVTKMSHLNFCISHEFLSY